MNTSKFVHLDTSRLPVEDLAGLMDESIDLVKSAPPGTLSDLITANLQTAETELEILNSVINKKKGSKLTPAIQAEDTKRDEQFAEIKRVSKTASQSLLPLTAAAGKKMVETLKPFWDINKKSIPTQTTQINVFKERYNADPDAVAAAATLGLTPIVTDLFASNDTLFDLYNQRVSELAAAAGPSATSVKADVVKAYDNLCEGILLTLRALPTEHLQLLFNELNEIRRKYISHLPTPLDETHTTVEPIAIQAYTGAPVTPLPKVHFQTKDETVELQFSKDYYVTYRNNTEVGEAKLLVHGTGKYTGKYETTFHIAEV
ncbi:MAG: DUF6261 family protein [Prevotellaceae bacterium]|jgi:hypothetical protein|nr:DUF6261 family protein [Prevotellaceae bacterium]